LYVAILPSVVVPSSDAFTPAPAVAGAFSGCQYFVQPGSAAHTELFFGMSAVQMYSVRPRPSTRIDAFRALL